MSEEELSSKIKAILTKFSSVKTSKANKEESFTQVLREMLEIKADSASKAAEEHYLALAQMIEYLFDQKIVPVTKNLKDEEICQLNKFFYMTYERISRKENVLSLKPTKLFPFHQELIAKSNIGMIHRSLFSTQKVVKKG